MSSTDKKHFIDRIQIHTSVGDLRQLNRIKIRYFGSISPHEKIFRAFLKVDFQDRQ